MNVFLSPLSKRQKEIGNQITKRDHSSKNIADDTSTLATPPPPPKPCLRNAEAVFCRAAPVNCHPLPKKKKKMKGRRSTQSEKKYERRRLSLFGMSFKVLQLVARRGLRHVAIVYYTFGRAVINERKKKKKKEKSDGLYTSCLTGLPRGQTWKGSGLKQASKQLYADR